MRKPASYRYDAWGDLLGSTGDVENAYLFTGEQYDAGLDQYYLRARYYDQNVGRFTSMDTWMGASSNPVTLHKYLYANNAPAYYKDPSGYMSIASLGTSIGMVGALTMVANVGITGLGMANASLDADQVPDAAIFTIGGSVGSGGAMAEAGGDVIVDFKTGRTWTYAWGGVGLSPVSLFKKFKAAGSTKSVGLIWNFNNPNEWSGFSVGANWPARILHLLPAASFSGSKMWGAMTQLAKREKSARSSDITVQIGVSTGGPVAVRVSQRANSFSAGVGFGSNPIEIPTGRFGSLARQLANDFGTVLDEL